MFTCSKYRVNMLAEKADANCARRFETSLDEHSTIHDFDKCRTCNRGAIMYELGKHKTDAGPDRREKNPAKAETIPGKIETIQAKGETIMGTERTFKKNCSMHGEFISTGPRGICPACKEAKEANAGTTKALKVRRKSASLVSHPSSVPAVLSGSEPGGGALPISIDLARFPKLHSRLITVGLNAMLAELETKA